MKYAKLQPKLIARMTSLHCHTAKFKFPVPVSVFEWNICGKSTFPQASRREKMRSAVDPRQVLLGVLVPRRDLEEAWANNLVHGCFGKSKIRD